MNAEKFMQGVLQRMLSCIRDEVDYIASPPPGRKPPQKCVEMYHWYCGLSETDRDMVRRLVHETHEEAVFSILMVLDHKAFVESQRDKGELELFYRAPSGERVRLNPLGGENGRDLEYYFKTLRESTRGRESTIDSNPFGFR